MDKKGYPDRTVAELMLIEAHAQNPGPWADHSRVCAKCAEKIAEACGLESDKAYILGLMHDIGRIYGKGHLRHVYDGYSFMKKVGFDEAARICLTHSFCIKSIDQFIGNIDVSESELEEIKSALAHCDYDDYDLLIQLCDAVAMAEGAVDIEDRMNDVKERYGSYPQKKWDRNLELKRYFELKSGGRLEEILKGTTAL